MEFGTGALKITPAHDINDYEIGQKHNLPMIDALDDDGKLNEHGLHYNGKDRFEVRKLIAKELEENNLLVKAEDYVNKVGTLRELSCNWTKNLSTMVPENVWNCEASFGCSNEWWGEVPPEKFKKYIQTLDGKHPRLEYFRQLWWGQQIPAYYYGEGSEDYVVAENIEEALVLAKEKPTTNN